MGEKLITIIIATYNAEQYLQRAIDSFISQSIMEKELIIIDGGSSDKTVEIIQKNSNVVDYWISEKDNGITDAWNKGIKETKGKWILFLGADDLLEKDILINLKNDLSSDNVSDLLIGNVKLVDSQGQVQNEVPASWNKKEMKKKMAVSHQGIFHSSNLFKKLGFYDTSYKLTADYEFILRDIDNVNVGIIPKTISKMQVGGLSDSQIFKVFYEWRKAKLKNKVSNRFFIESYYYYRYLRSYLSRRILKGKFR